MKRLWAILNDEGKISVMEKTETGLTCLKWVKDNDELGVPENNRLSLRNEGLLILRKNN